MTLPPWTLDAYIFTAMVATMWVLSTLWSMRSPACPVSLRVLDVGIGLAFGLLGPVTIATVLLLKYVDWTERE